LLYVAELSSNKINPVFWNPLYISAYVVLYGVYQLH